MRQLARLRVATWAGRGCRDHSPMALVPGSRVAVGPGGATSTMRANATVAVGPGREAGGGEDRLGGNINWQEGNEE